MSSGIATGKSLLTLPPELLDHITGYLNDEVLPTLRLVSKPLQTAIFDRFCEAYVAHLGCWIISKDRWERLYNLLSASSTPLSNKMQTITFTLDELELRSEKDFVSVSGYPRKREGDEYHRNHRVIASEQHWHARHNIIKEKRYVKDQGAAHLVLMLRVLHQAKLRGCFIRLDLSPGHPCSSRTAPAPLNPHAKEVHSDLQRAITETKPLVEAISIDHDRRRVLEDVMGGYEDDAFESFASLRDFTMTFFEDESATCHRDKNMRYDVVTAIFMRASGLRKVNLDVPGHFVYAGFYERAQRWTSNLLLSNVNGLRYLESLTLMDVPLSQNDLIEIFRRCSRTLLYLHLRLDPKASPEETWLRLWERQASMERLYLLELQFPDSWCQKSLSSHEPQDCIRFSRKQTFKIKREEKFATREEVTQGLARITEAEKWVLATKIAL
jgi:hypothetical protein